MKFLLFAFLAVPCLARLNHRIVGGEDAELGEFPWQASLERFGSHSCGGSLISENYVLCAAHCTQGSVSDYTVVLGQHNRFDSDGSPTDHSVDRVINHPSYGSGAGFSPNDVSLLHLSQPAQLGEFIQIIRLADGPNDYENYRGVISGWGATQGGGGLPSILQRADVTAWDNAYCENQFGDSYQRDIMICLWEQNQSGACNGDSGGPFVVVDDDGEYTQAGVTSWGYGGCPTWAPSVYARVGAFRSWIDGIIV